MRFYDTSSRPVPSTQYLHADSATGSTSGAEKTLRSAPSKVAMFDDSDMHEALAAYRLSVSPAAAAALPPANTEPVRPQICCLAGLRTGFEWLQDAGKRLTAPIFAGIQLALSWVRRQLSWIDRRAVLDNTWQASSQKNRSIAEHFAEPSSRPSTEHPHLDYLFDKDVTRGDDQFYYLDTTTAPQTFRRLRPTDKETYLASFAKPTRADISSSDWREYNIASSASSAVRQLCGENELTNQTLTAWLSTNRGAKASTDFLQIKGVSVAGKHYAVLLSSEIEYPNSRHHLLRNSLRSPLTPQQAQFVASSRYIFRTATFVPVQDLSVDTPPGSFEDTPSWKKKTLQGTFIVDQSVRFDTQKMGDQAPRLDGISMRIHGTYRGRLGGAFFFDHKLGAEAQGES